LANGSDFDESTGQITAGRQVVLLDETQARELQVRLRAGVWTVSTVEERPNNRKPAPPFTTSTLQQEANRKLRLSARDTMRVAQNLYEQGYITYMRTDSVHLSEQAISAARACVQSRYGTEYLSPKPRQYATKSKGAQEAHEAIRPAGSTFRTPNETGLTGREASLYDLIWKRTVASQMAEARQTNITASIEVDNAIFRATGKRIDFPGFFRAYVEGSDDPDAAIENQEVLLPALAQGDALSCRQLEAIGHETQPPARYTEATLVKVLESEGIGRPSTYATVIGTIIDRGYVRLVNNSLIPTFTAFAVTALLEQNFPDLVDVHFTARMEQTLDDISTGEVEWLPYLKAFYSGDQGLETLVQERETQIDPTAARTVLLEDLDAKIRIGRYGPYVEIGTGEESVKASIPADVSPADLDSEQIERIIKQKVEGPDKVGLHPDTGEPIFLRIGPYGPYVQLGEPTDDNPNPKRASLPKGTQAEAVTLEMAVGLLMLPRKLGQHPETGASIKAGQGRFGPYIVHDQGKEGRDYRSLKGDDDVLTVTLERSLELLAQPKAGRGRKKVDPLKDLGAHPDDNESVAVFNGPYGLYVKHGKINASVPEGVDLEAISLEQALGWINAKAPAKKGKAGSKKSATSRTTKTAAASKASGTKKTTKTASTTKSATEAKKSTRTMAAKTTKTTTRRSTTPKSTAKKASEPPPEADD
jgi:DNA topoisomerase-1